MHSDPLYILKFTPILKEKIWGGTKLHTLLQKTAAGDAVGESWEISDVEHNCSIVQNGALAGASLRTLLTNYKEALLGHKNYQRFGNQFPLLIKFIDAKEDLSVQLHPGDTIAKRKHNSLGKTEMWYVVQAEPEANIIIGFNQQVDRPLYEQHVAEKTIKDILHYEPVSSGDTFFVYSGLIHAIGKGVLLAEIQQTSDITYRVYDWDRTDKQGNYRELHQQDAAEAIDFENTTPYKVPYTLQPNHPADLVNCTHFITNVIEVTETVRLNHTALDSFVIYMCVAGSAQVTCVANSIDIQCGETFLVPASISEITIQAVEAKLLQVYI